MEITDKELLTAWDKAFDKPQYFVEKPTEETLLIIRLRAVADAAIKKYLEDNPVTK